MVALLNTPTYLSDCLYSLRQFRKIQKEITTHKVSDPAGYAQRQKENFTILLSDANNALMELLGESDFAQYIKEKIGRSRVTYLIRDKGIVISGQQLTIVQSTLGSIELKAYKIEPTGQISDLEFSEDEEFLYELRSCQNPEYLIGFIVDALGEPQ